MTKKEKESIIQMLDTAVERYLLFRNREDYPDKPCVRRETCARQSAVFNLADYLHKYGFITWEKCCEYWVKVDIIDGIENEPCTFTNCGGNVDGKCKYTIPDNLVKE